MNCYTHETTPAIGICSVCAKGVCKNCHQLEETIVVCSQECAQQKKYLKAVNDRAMRIYQIGPYHTESKTIPTISIVYLLLTILMGGATVLLADTSDLATIYMTGLLTLMFLVIAMITWSRYKKRGIDF